MSSLFQMNSGIVQILIILGISLIIMTLAALNMVDKKRIGLFMSFFIFGLGVCLTVAFMVYDFFGVAVDVFYVVAFVSSVGVFFNLWRVGR